MKKNIKEVKEKQAKKRASRVVNAIDAYEFLEEQDFLSREEELLSFKRSAGIIDDESEIDYESMQTLFDRVA